ncbi:uncharacterized protein M6B38_168745 [Iris pallida]|uniref:CCHC-type domain-containing protein n=1 Tax=Iris pallida TaxID=29817 RepID=A0AAX6EVG1_IRIPA|nr:uncharacterized protein M6B38_168745 [Iris pallida]
MMTKTHPQASGSSSLPERPDQAEEEVHETAPSDSTIPETQAVAQGGLPPPSQRVTAVLPEILPPLPPIPTDTHHLFLLLQQMMETQRAQAEASQRQSEASHRQMEMLRQSMENSHQLALAAVERVAPGTVQGPTGQQPSQQQSRPGTVLDFTKMSSRDFTGTEGILYADDWLEDVERSMELAELPRALWVSAAASRFFDIALTWYRTDPRASVRGLTWENFRRLFKEKFFPDVALTALEGQFVGLVQGNSSVDEYAAEFFRLSRFAPGMIQDEGQKARKFRRGLIHAVRTRTSGRRDATFDQILMDAQIAEEDFGLKPKRSGDTMGASSSAGPSKRPHIQQQQQRPFQQQPLLQIQQAPARVQQHQGQGQRQTQQCVFCGKTGHSRDVCRRRLGACLFCGGTDHQLKGCPARAAKGGQDRVQPARGPAVQQRGPPLQTQQQRFVQHQRGAPAGRVFALAAEEETEPVGDVVADDSDADCSTYYGLESDGVALDRGLIVEPLDFVLPE